MVCTRVMNEKTPAETVIKEVNNNNNSIVINITILNNNDDDTVNTRNDNYSN